MFDEFGSGSGSVCSGAAASGCGSATRRSGITAAGLSYHAEWSASACPAPAPGSRLAAAPRGCPSSICQRHHEAHEGGDQASPPARPSGCTRPKASMRIGTSRGNSGASIVPVRTGRCPANMAPNRALASRRPRTWSASSAPPPDPRRATPKAECSTTSGTRTGWPGEPPMSQSQPARHPSGSRGTPRSASVRHQVEWRSNSLRQMRRHDNVPRQAPAR